VKNPRSECLKTVGTARGEKRQKCVCRKVIVVATVKSDGGGVKQAQERGWNSGGEAPVLGKGNRWGGGKKQRGAEFRAKCARGEKTEEGRRGKDVIERMGNGGGNGLGGEAPYVGPPVSQGKREDAERASRGKWGLTGHHPCKRDGSGLGWRDRRVGGD